MKVGARQADGFCKAPPKACGVLVIYGPDQGQVKDRARAACVSVLDPPDDPFRVADLTMADLAETPSRLMDEAATLDLMGGRRLVRLRGATDACAAGVKAVVEADLAADCLVVVEAGELGPASKLRKLAEQAPNAAAVPCYLPDAGGIARFIADSLAAAGLGVDRDAEQALVDNLIGDRDIARRELEKLALYMGGGSETRVGLADVEAVIGDMRDRTLDDAVFAACDGDMATANRVCERLIAEGTSEVAILRAAQRHLMRLMEAASAVAAGQSPDQAMAKLRPPVFFKLQDRFRRQMDRWRRQSLLNALERLAEAEAQCKRTGMPAATLTSRVLFQIASLARR